MKYLREPAVCLQINSLTCMQKLKQHYPLYVPLKIPWRRMATHPSILAWRIPWTEEPGGLLTMGSQRVGHYRRDTHTHTHKSWGASLVVQWLRLFTPKAGGADSIPGQGTRSHMPKLRIRILRTKIEDLHAPAKTWHSQINKNKYFLMHISKCPMQLRTTPIRLQRKVQ